jgi:hypothetical protein
VHRFELFVDPGTVHIVDDQGDEADPRIRAYDRPMEHAEARQIVDGRDAAHRAGHRSSLAHFS